MAMSIAPTTKNLVTSTKNEPQHKAFVPRLLFLLIVNCFRNHDLSYHQSVAQPTSLFSKFANCPFEPVSKVKHAITTIMSSSNISGQHASYAILFDKTLISTPAEGYLFVDMLRKGGCSSGVMLVRSVESGKLYVRKYIAPQDEKEFNLWESEVCFTCDLTDSAFSVRFHSACSNDDGEYRTLVTEFCDGGSCQDWFGRHATPENREFMAWLLIVEATRALAYLHSDNATDQGGLWQGDVHLGNIFLHFGDQIIPRILFGDFGLSLHRHEVDKAEFQGQDLACDLGYIGEMKLTLYNNPVEPPVAESMRQILSLFPRDARYRQRTTASGQDRSRCCRTDGLPPKSA